MNNRQNRRDAGQAKPRESRGKIMSKSGRFARREHLRYGGLIFSLCLSGLGTARAQVAAPPPANPVTPETLQEVTVTGSHITNPGFTAPTPVTVLGQQRVDELGITNVGDALNQLPSFRALVTPATQQAVGGNIGSRQLDLRGLGATRTLVLVDGQRFVPSTAIGTVDVNLIPSILVERTEVVTGGASAAYGSDAVAGVVNFILDNKLEGFKGDLQYGISQRSDDKDTTASMAFGTSFAGGRAHFIGALEYDNNKGMGDCYTRSAWCPNEQLVSNSPAGYGGLPASLRVGPDGAGNLGFDGLINAGPLRGTTFNSNGTLRSFQYGQIFGTNLNPVFMLGGEGSSPNGYLSGILMMPPVNRKNAYARFDVNFSDSVKGSLALSYGGVDGMVVGSLARGNFTINRDNAYLPAELGTEMDANGLTSVSLGREFGDLGGSVDYSRNQTYRAVASLQGVITSSWSWDAYYEYAQNRFEQNYTGDVVMSRLTNAINAVNVNGSIVCAANAVTQTAPGCVPFNVFGAGNSSAAADAYVAPSGYQTDNTTENVVSANLHGDVFDLPAGPASVATGVEYRSDRMSGSADALSTANAFWSFNGKAINGQQNVKEVYGEAVVPVLKDAPFARKLELNGAVRRTYYDRSSPDAGSSSTNATTWKGGLVYKPVDELLFRATRSLDIRAPNLTELFGPVALTRTTIIDPKAGGNQIQVNDLNGSNPLLQPEKADTTTIGVVFTPQAWNWLKPLQLSADWFNIDINGAIATYGAQNIVNQCAAGVTALCQYVTRDANGVLTQLEDVNQNVNQMVVRGLDVEAGYGTDLGAWGALDYHLYLTRYFEYSTTTAAGTIDRAGQTGYRPGTVTGVPDYILDGLITWKVDRVTLGVHGHFIPRGIFDVTLVGPGEPGYDPTKANSIANNNVASSFLVDLSGSLQVSKNVEVYAVIDNLFDRDPPLDASAQGGTNQVYFDPVGRYFKMGVRVTL